jgi:type IV secretion system protein VirB6
MNTACQALVDDGVIRGVLATVDCQTREYALMGYESLTHGSPVFQTALTSLLTIYVAAIGWRMMFAQGATRLSDAPGIALSIGAILALVTSWSAFQTIVFDMADRAPLEIAAIISAPMQGGGGLASNPVDGLQLAYDELSNTGAAYGKIVGPDAKSYSSPEAAAAEATGMASGALFLMSAGVISAATLAIGVLTAVGPIFIALFLMPTTRGLFAGWARALLAAALTPMVAWILLVLMLAVLEPWIVTLAAQRAAKTMDAQTAISTAALVFVFTLGQFALVIGACIMAIGFRLPRLRTERAAAAAPSPQVLAAAAEAGREPSRAERLALDLRRDQAQDAARARTLQLAASVTHASQARAPSAAEAPARLGDAYRRPAFVARRVGVAR